jgi:protein involved in polysaccharide export with SLBB domain
VTLALLLFTLGCSPAVISPAPLPASHGNSSEYRIQPGDQMDVKFFYNPELNESVTVRPDGRVSLQLAQEIPAAGLTPAELTQVLKARYARELDQPEITVILRSFAGQRVYVDGEVNKPALVPLAASMTLLQSISLAGGLKDSARTSEIVIIRRGAEGKPSVFSVDLTRVLDGTDTGQDVALMPFDVVYVPRSPIANVNLWVDQYLRKNLPVSFGLFYQIGGTN